MGRTRFTTTVFVPKLKKSAGKRDPAAPKKALSAFMRFSVKRRPLIKTENPALAFGDVAKQLSEEWSALPDKEKKALAAEASADAARYSEELKTYRAAHPPAKPDVGEMAPKAAKLAIKAFAASTPGARAPKAAKLAYVPLPARATAERVLKMLESAETKKAQKWLEKNALSAHAGAFSESCPGVVIPLSKAEEKNHNKEKRGHFFMVSFNY